MNKKSLLGLILFAGIITSALFFCADILVNQGNSLDQDSNRTYVADENGTEDKASDDNITDKIAKSENKGSDSLDNTAAKDSSEKSDAATSQKASEEPDDGEASVDIVDNTSIGLVAEEPWLSSNPSDTGDTKEKPLDPSESDTTGLPQQDMAQGEQVVPIESGDPNPKESDGTAVASVNTTLGPQLIYDSKEVDYAAYIPEMLYDKELAIALDIINPSITIDAEAAILFDAKTKKVLYYKNPVTAEFPASTAKLLTSIVVLDNCKEEEVVTVGEEITMIASDSTTAGIRVGQQLTIRNLLEGMLLPSGNDAAYSVAAYVGRKSLKNELATKEEAIAEFVRLMNEQAKRIGVKNSSFKTPDGYDAIGQFTTAYDMGLIGMAAIGYDTITEISQKRRSRNILVSGEDVTWDNTNKLINRDYVGQYYSYAIGLKTGTSTMAGRCLVAAARKDDREVVCVILDSSSSGRWEDAITLLKYGINK